MTKTKTYDPNVHSYVSFNHRVPGLGDGSFYGPCVIVHHVGARVWVPACYADFPAPAGTDVVMVGDGKTSGYDEAGGCIASVSADYVAAYLTDDEAEAVDACMKADADMLANAY